MCCIPTHTYSLWIDDEDDDEDEDELTADSKIASAKDKRSRMKFENCQIKPCAIKAKQNRDKIPGEYTTGILLNLLVLWTCRKN